VTGALNDDPGSAALKPLLAGTSLTDIGEHPAFEWGPRRGTFQGGNASDKIDYVLLSPAVFARPPVGECSAKVCGGGRGRRTSGTCTTPSPATCMSRPIMPGHP
jgi:hypothetical protein